MVIVKNAIIKLKIVIKFSFFGTLISEYFHIGTITSLAIVGIVKTPKIIVKNDVVLGF